MNNCRVRNKECYKNCKLEYEGEYLFNDKQNGKFYNYAGNVIIEYNNGIGNGILEIREDKLSLFQDEVIEEKYVIKL